MKQVQSKSSTEGLIVTLNSTEGFGSHIGRILVQDLIVLADCRQKYDGGDILKAVDPFPPL